MDDKLTKPISLHLDQELDELVRNRAKELRLSITDVIRLAIIQEFKGEK